MAEETNTNRDVRMRGFTGRALVDDALRWVDEQSKTLPGETIAFNVAHGRVLSGGVSSPLDVPSFDRSAMDGYAVRGTETEGASDYNPLGFPIVGESMPGHPFSETMPPGTDVRIMTGAPVPTGADAVIPAEYATETGETVEITSTVSPGKHVGRRGEDVSANSQLFAAGRRLRPQDVGLLASVGVTDVEAVRRPRVRLLITGNELVVPGNKRGEFQIYESNSSVLAALVHRDGAELESLIPASRRRKKKPMLPELEADRRILVPHFLPSFYKSLEGKERRSVERAIQAILLFCTEGHAYPGLEVKQLGGQDTWSLRASLGLRVYFRPLTDGDIEVIELGDREDQNTTLRRLKDK